VFEALEAKRAEGTRITQTEGQAMKFELIFMDVSDKTEIGRAHFDQEFPSAMPCIGDCAEILDSAEPIKVAYVRVKGRDFCYNQSPGSERLAYVRLWCERVEGKK
jgi:hypothetical protein